MWPDLKKKEAKRKKKLAKRNKKAAKRKKKAAKLLRGSSGKKIFRPSSHGRNRLFPSSEIKRMRWQFVTVRSTPRTTNRSRTTHILATRHSRIRSRRQLPGKDRLAREKSRSTSCTLSLKTSPSKNQRSASEKSTTPITSGRLKTSNQRWRMTSALSRIQNTTSIRPDIPKKTAATMVHIFSGSINTFLITPITMRRQARHWQRRANTITTSLT